MLELRPCLTQVATLPTTQTSADNDRMAEPFGLHTANYVLEAMSAKPCDQTTGSTVLLPHASSRPHVPAVTAESQSKRQSNGINQQQIAVF